MTTYDSSAADHVMKFPKSFPSVLAYCKRSKTGGVEGLGTRLPCSPFFQARSMHQAQSNILVPLTHWIYQTHWTHWNHLTHQCSYPTHCTHQTHWTDLTGLTKVADTLDSLDSLNSPDSLDQSTFYHLQSIYQHSLQLLTWRFPPLHWHPGFRL